MFKSNIQAAYAITTENKGSFIIMVGIGINQKCAWFEDGALCKDNCVKMPNGETGGKCKNIAVWCHATASAVF
jgi:hypothetical protein